MKASKFQKYKEQLALLNIELELSDHILENAIFAGLAFGLFVNEKLVITLPYFTSESSDYKEYHYHVNMAFKKHGTLRKVALYKNRLTNSYFAVSQKKALFYRLNSLFLIRHGSEQFKKYKNEMSIDVFFEDLSSNNVYGVLEKDKNGMISFLPFKVFNKKLLGEDFVFDLALLTVFLGLGHYIEGYYTPATPEKNRTFQPNYIPSYLKFTNCKIQSFPCAYDVAIKDAIYDKKQLFIEDYFINSTILVGDPVDLDWFGREFGFWIKDNEALYKLNPCNPLNNNLTCPINELND